MSALAHVQGGQQAASARTPAEYVLARMRGIWGAKVNRDLSSAEAVRAWAREANAQITRSRLTVAQLDAGLDRARETLEWPPIEIPVLLRLCLDVPDFEAAFAEAQVGAYRRQQGEATTWSHPAVYWAADRLGWYEVRNTGWAQIGRRWQATLLEVMAWGTWPPIEPVFLPDSRGPQTRAVQQAALAKARELLRGAKTKIAEGWPKQTPPVE